jgi:hypothetical protein
MIDNTINITTNEKQQPKMKLIDMTFKDWAITMLIIIGVVAVGMIAFNQVLGYFYKSEFLQTPCELCVKLNPEWKQCYDHVTTPKRINSTYINYTEVYKDLLKK